MRDRETGPETPAELTARLRVLLCQARDNGIEVQGGWECLNGDEYPDWDVVVTEVRKTDRTARTDRTD